MRVFLYSVLIAFSLNQPVWADNHDEVTSGEEDGIKIEISMDEDSDNSEDSEAMTEEELERKIKGKVFSIIGTIADAAADAAEDELTEEDKAEIKEELKEAMREIEETVEEMEEDHKVVTSSDDDDGIFDDGISFIEALIPLTAIVFTFGMPIMIVAVVLYSSYRKKRLMHDTINQYVSSGKDIPPEVLKGLQKEATPKNNLHRGLVMSGIGLGIFFCFTIIGSVEAGALGLIPLFIGLAQLLIWKLENKENRD